MKVKYYHEYTGKNYIFHVNDAIERLDTDTNEKSLFIATGNLYGNGRLYTAYSKLTYDGNGVYKIKEEDEGIYIQYRFNGHLVMTHQ